jgi:hypothetical protein
MIPKMTGTSNTFSAAVSISSNGMGIVNRALRAAPALYVEQVPVLGRRTRSPLVESKVPKQAGQRVPHGRVMVGAESRDAGQDVPLTRGYAAGKVR